MTRDKIQELLGEIIQLYGLIVFCGNNKTRKKIEEKYKSIETKNKYANNRLERFIEQSKWNFQGPSAFFIALIIGYVLWKKIIIIKSTFWFIVLLFFTALIIAPNIRKVAYSIQKNLILKKHPDLKEELESTDKILQAQRETMDYYDAKDKQFIQVIKEDFYQLELTEEEQDFLTVLYYFKYRMNKECETIEECRKKYQNDKIPKRYSTTSDPNKTEPFVDYLERCIDNETYGISEKDRKRIIKQLPKLKPEYVEVIETIKNIKED